LFSVSRSFRSVAVAGHEDNSGGGNDGENKERHRPEARGENTGGQNAFVCVECTRPVKSLWSLKNVLIFQSKALFLLMKITLNLS